MGLAMLGLYAVISFGVAQRTHEIGIRIALGADRTNVQRLVIVRGIKLALMGIAVGAAAALGLSHLLQAVLFGVSSCDPVVYACVTLLLLSVAAVASGLPGLPMRADEEGSDLRSRIRASSPASERRWCLPRSQRDIAKRRTV